VAVITKSALVLRDLDILAALAKGPGATVTLSIPFEDPGEARRIEPFASAPEARFQALEKLSAGGVRTGLSISPVIPGWNDDSIPRLLRRAADHGASFAFYTLLRLPGSTAEVFLSRLHAEFPERSRKVEHHQRAVRGGALNRNEFGKRFEGEGQMAALIEDLFRVHARKNGLNKPEKPKEGGPSARSLRNLPAQSSEIQPNEPVRQLNLFE
jgi:DNA repair photolyase